MHRVILHCDIANFNKLCSPPGKLLKCVTRDEVSPRLGFEGEPSGTGVLNILQNDAMYLLSVAILLAW